jgi:hypothetical protein
MHEKIEKHAYSKDMSIGICICGAIVLNFGVVSVHLTRDRFDSLAKGINNISQLLEARDEKLNAIGTTN